MDRRSTDQSYILGLHVDLVIMHGICQSVSVVFESFREMVTCPRLAGEERNPPYHGCKDAPVTSHQVTGPVMAREVSDTWDGDMSETSW